MPLLPLSREWVQLHGRRGTRKDKRLCVGTDCTGCSVPVQTLFARAHPERRGTAIGYECCGRLLLAPVGVCGHRGAGHSLLRWRCLLWAGQNKMSAQYQLHHIIYFLSLLVHLYSVLFPYNFLKY